MISSKAYNTHNNNNEQQHNVGTNNPTFMKNHKHHCNQIKTHIHISAKSLNNNKQQPTTTNNKQQPPPTTTFHITQGEEEDDKS